MLQTTSNDGRKTAAGDICWPRFCLDCYGGIVFHSGKLRHNVLSLLSHCGWALNSLVPRRPGCDFLKSDFQSNGTFTYTYHAYDNAIRWIPRGFIDHNSTLVQVMAWCHQAHWALYKIATILQTIFSNDIFLLFWLKMCTFWNKFHWSLFLNVINNKSRFTMKSWQATNCYLNH